MSKGGAISDPIKFGEAQKMPYLQAVIKEGQRMYPAAGLPLWRVVPEPGATLCGKFFPPGVSGDRSRHHRIVKKADKHQTTVGVNSWVAHRNTQQSLLQIQTPIVLNVGSSLVPKSGPQWTATIHSSFDTSTLSCKEIGGQRTGGW
jgi:hypothetical protein